MSSRDSSSLGIRMSVMSGSWWGSTTVAVIVAGLIAIGLPWSGVLIPIKVVVLAATALIWIRVAVVRPARIESREGMLMLRPGTLSKPRTIEWKYIDSILLWTLNFQGTRGMIGVRLKKGVPKSVRVPEGTPERFKGYPEGWPASREVTDAVRAYSIALGWVRPEALVDLVEAAAPGVKVIDIRDPRNPVELWRGTDA